MFSFFELEGWVQDSKNDILELKNPFLLTLIIANFVDGQDLFWQKAKGWEWHGITPDRLL